LLLSAIAVDDRAEADLTVPGHPSALEMHGKVR
jgi:hypothetical protein